tara:strand:+ start:213 stop:452 length:240 start_codon:yes stop_codon:yes gene_type:complete
MLEYRNSLGGFSGGFDISAGWQSGDAAACKAVNAGSIPASASNKNRDVNNLSLLVGKKVEELFFHRSPVFSWSHTAGGG